MAVHGVAWFHTAICFNASKRLIPQEEPGIAE